MKKLISLLAVVAILASSVLCVFADTTITLPEELTLLEANNENIYEVNVEGLSSAYATILAVKGTTIKVGAIQYINQDATNGGAATFNFALNNDLLNNETSSLITDDVYVLTGGDGNVNVAGYIDVTPEEDDRTAFTVSGTVTNVVPVDFIEGVLPEVIGEVFGGEGLADYQAAYATNAYIIDLETIDGFIGSYFEGTNEFPYLAKAEVSNVDGTYSFADVENGTYALVITRAGALPYMDYLTVDGADVTVDSVELFLGDLEGHTDVLIDPEDVSAMVSVLSVIGEDNFNPKYDIVPDILVDPEDVAKVVSNMVTITEYGTQLVLDLFS